MSKETCFFQKKLLRDASFIIVLVAGWSDNGWLSGGHAVRMAMELCKSLSLLYRFRPIYIILAIAMHKAWPVLLKRMNSNQIDMVADRELVVASRIWFCLYLFEHQYVLQAYFSDLY